MPTDAPTPRHIAQELAAWAERNPLAAYQLFAAVGYPTRTEPTTVTLDIGPHEPTLDDVFALECSDDARVALLFDHTQQAIAAKSTRKSARSL